MQVLMSAAENRRVRNSNRLGSRYEEVPHNVTGILPTHANPDAWFPATGGEVDDASLAQVDSLLQFYQLDVDGDLRDKQILLQRYLMFSI